MHEYGFYCGAGTDVTACIKLTEAMKEDSLIDKDATGIQPTVSTDRDVDFISVLKNLSYKGKPVLTHVFANLNRMKEEHVAHIENLVLPPNAPKEAQIESRKEQHRYMKEAATCKDLFCGGFEFCYQCGKMCPISEMDVMMITTAPITESQLLLPSDDESQMPRDESQQMPPSDDESQMPQQLPPTQMPPGSDAEMESPSKVRRTVRLPCASKGPETIGSMSIQGK